MALGFYDKSDSMVQSGEESFMVRWSMVLFGEAICISLGAFGSDIDLHLCYA